MNYLERAIFDNPPVTIPKYKDELREEIAKQIDTFFANDGHITEIPFGVSGDDMTTHYHTNLQRTKDVDHLRDRILKIPGFEGCLVYHKEKRGYFCEKTSGMPAIHLGKTFDEAKKKAKTLYSCKESGRV